MTRLIPDIWLFSTNGRHQRALASAFESCERRSYPTPYALPVLAQGALAPDDRTRDWRGWPPVRVGPSPGAALVARAAPGPSGYLVTVDWQVEGATHADFSLRRAGRFPTRGRKGPRCGRPASRARR
jgi:hypothetical protein